MSNAKIYYKTETDVDPTATNEDGDYPLSYAFDNNLKSEFRTDVITESIIKWNFSVAQQLKGICIVNHSQPDITFKIEASNDDFTTTPFSEDLSVISSYTLHTLNLSTYKDIQVRMQSSSGTYMSIGQIFFAIESYVFDRNINTDFIAGKTTRSIINKSPQSGRITKKITYQKYSHSYGLNAISKTQATKFEEINGYNYIIWQPDSDIETEFYYGVNNFDLPQNLSNTELKNISGSFEESL